MHQPIRECLLLPRWNVALVGILKPGGGAGGAHVLLLDVIHRLREAAKTGLRQLPVDALQALIVKSRQVLLRSITIIFQRISSSDAKWTSCSVTKRLHPKCMLCFSLPGNTSLT